MTNPKKKKYRKLKQKEMRNAIITHSHKINMTQVSNKFAGKKIYDGAGKYEFGADIRVDFRQLSFGREP